MRGAGKGLATALLAVRWPAPADESGPSVLTQEPPVSDPKAIVVPRPTRTAPAKPSQHNLLKLSRRAIYVGSPEHKDRPSPAGTVPRPRPDASICPLVTAEAFRRAQRWLRQAIAAGRVSGPYENGWPRYVYHREGDTIFEARLTNREKGEYKGYPIEPDQLPPGIEW